MKWIKAPPIKDPVVNETNKIKTLSKLFLEMKRKRAPTKASSPLIIVTRIIQVSIDGILEIKGWKGF